MNHFDELSVANRQVNAVKDGGSNPDIPASIPVILCARRQEINSPFVISLPPLWRQGSVLRCMCILGNNDHFRPATNLQRRDFVRIRQLAPNRTGKGRHIPENPPQGCCTVLELRRASLAELQIRAAVGYTDKSIWEYRKTELDLTKPPRSVFERIRWVNCSALPFWDSQEPLSVLTRFCRVPSSSKSVILSRLV